MRVIQAEEPLHDMGIPVQRKLTKRFYDMLYEFAEDQFPSPLWDENDRILAIPFSAVCTLAGAALFGA